MSPSGVVVFDGLQQGQESIATDEDDFQSLICIPHCHGHCRGDSSADIHVGDTRETLHTDSDT